jgi:rubredoxin
MGKKGNYLLLALVLLAILVIPACSSGLLEIEKEGITYIFEVEKVAHDVYQYLYDKWGTPVMNTISQSEQQHMGILKAVMDKYNITDPSDGNDIGEFTNSDLQKLYSELVAQGSSSETNAISTAAMIEEFDIVDIKKYIEQTKNDDTITAYDKLIRGSENHLRIFVSNLKDKGIEYHPEYLSQEDFDQGIAFTTPSMATVGSSNLSLYICPTKYCGYLYDPNLGDPTTGIPAGTPFEELPAGWQCPQCGAKKGSFIKYG